jgi:plastocyanin
MFPRAILLLLVTGAAAGAEHTVLIGPGLVYTPASLTIRPGDSVRFEAYDAHPLISDDRSFACLTECVVRFDRIGSHGYHCDTHGGPGTRMAGTVHVVDGGATLPIGAQFDGVWREPGIDGQGFYLHAMPSTATLVAGWFTWADSPDAAPEWLTAVGPILGDRAELDLLRSRGGRFDASTAVTTESVGSATLRFFDCTTATLQYTRDDLFRSGLIDLRRLTPVPPGCSPAEPR